LNVSLVCHGVIILKILFYAGLSIGLHISLCACLCISLSMFLIAFRRILPSLAVFRSTVVVIVVFPCFDFRQSFAVFHRLSPTFDVFWVSEWTGRMLTDRKVKHNDSDSP